jgi:hypothetical protein
MREQAHRYDNISPSFLIRQVNNTKNECVTLYTNSVTFSIFRAHCPKKSNKIITSIALQMLVITVTNLKKDG